MTALMQNACCHLSVHWLLFSRPAFSGKVIEKHSCQYFALHYTCATHSAIQLAPFMAATCQIGRYSIQFVHGIVTLHLLPLISGV